MANYSYLMVPASVDKVITAAVEDFARQDERIRSYDIWRHGLPIWIASERAEGRVNQVQIEAVVQPGDTVAEPVKQQVVFTPGAYQDEGSYDKENARKDITRKVPSAQAVREARGFLSLADAEKPENVKGELENSLERARILHLEETLPPIRYATPFQ